MTTPSHTEMAARELITAYVARFRVPGRGLVGPIDEAVEALAAALESPTPPERVQPDCAGGSPCTDCPDKKKCQRGCLRQPEFIGQESPDRKGWKSECDAVDLLLRGLGLDPVRCRTEGGSLNVGRTLSLLKDGCATPSPQAATAGAELTDAQINEIWSAKDQPLHKSALSPFGMERIRAIIAAALRASTPAERVPLHETDVMRMAKEVGFNLEPTANMLYTVRGNAAQVINLVHAVERAHGIVTKESSNADQA